MQSKQKFFATIATIVIVFVVLLANSIFIVQEGTRAIKLRFNKVVRNSDGQVVVYQPGIHLKPPFIDSVVTMDARLQTLDDSADRFVTVEKKDVLIDSYVKWRIINFGKFYTTTGGYVERADNLLRRKINDRLRNEVGSQTISDIVSGSRSELMSQARIALNSGEDGASAFGIEVVDVRVNKIELPNEVSSSIYQRMRAERMAVAGEHRAKGKEEAAKIIAETDRNVQVILAEAQLQAEKIHATADATASQIYNSTYAQNPELFNFLKYLSSYKYSIQQGNTVLLIKPDQNSFYRYLFSDSLANTTLKPDVSKQQIPAPVIPQSVLPSLTTTPSK